MFKKILLLMGIVMGLPLLYLLTMKVLLERKAKIKATNMINEIEDICPENCTQNQFLATATEYFHQQFFSTYQPPSKEATSPQSSKKRAKQYLRKINRHLLRIAVDTGVREINAMTGMCDANARGFAYLLRQKGYNASQIDFVSIGIGGAHSALLLETQEGDIMLDAYYGVVPKYNDEIIGPAKIQNYLNRGVPSEEIFVPLATDSKLYFYKHFNNIVYAKFGEILEMKAEINLSIPKLVLGKKDGSSKDVNANTAKHGLFGFLHYIGHRYSRKWVRTLSFAQDTKMTIALIEKPKRKFITSTQAPIIKGNQLIWKIPAGGKISFIDGDAQRDWLKLQSYQDVDYIEFEKCDSIDSLC